MCVTSALEKKQFQKFCEIEAVSDLLNMSPEEKVCETFHAANTIRDSGDIRRFTVGLPFKDNPKKLGNSYNVALKPFYALERRLDRQVNLKSQYAAFFAEYLALGHMELDPPEEIHCKPNYYHVGCNCRVLSSRPHVIGST